jgi:transcription elongation factor SPT6
LQIRPLIFFQRIDVAPFVAPTTQIGDTPSVLAVSWGKGDPQKDAITLVFLDEAGRFREHLKIDNLVDSETRDDFNDLIQRRRPDVIAIGGFSLTTTKLSQRLKEAVGIPTQQVDNGLGHAWGDEPRPPSGQQDMNIPVIYVHDETARIYQHSKRADEEFSALSPIAKYCIGLARYVQSPLNEYAALGADMTAISFDEDSQQLVSAAKPTQP